MHKLPSRRRVAASLLGLGAAALVPRTALAADAGLDARLAAHAAKGFRGVVRIDRPDNPYLWTSEGVNPAATRYWCASMSKTMAAATAVRLAGRGALDLDLAVGAAFPFVTGDIAAVPLRRLLANRAGMGEHYAADGVTDREAAVRALVAHGLEKQGFFYSNDGFNLAAAMIEQATGKPYEVLLHEEVFAPAGMAASGNWGEAVDYASFADFHRPRGGKMLKDGQPIRNYGMFGAGGAYATADDLLAYLKAVRSPAYLDDAQRALLWTPGWSRPAGSPPKTGTSYGLGWALNVKDDVVAAAYHAGYDDVLGHSGMIKTWFDRPLALVIQSNSGEVKKLSWSEVVAADLEPLIAA